MTRKYKISLAILITIILIVSGFILIEKGIELKITENMITKLYGYRIDKESIIKEFDKNTSDFEIIALFFKNYKKEKGELIFIEKNNDSYTVEISSSNGDNWLIDVKDMNIDRALCHLTRDLHYKTICDDSGGNGVYFTLDDSNFGFSHGISFSKDGNNPDGWGNPVTTTEKLKDDWYYYEYN